MQSVAATASRPVARGAAARSEIRVKPLHGIPELTENHDLGVELARAIAAAGGADDGDVVVVAQKAVSKVEGREVRLEDVRPSPRALRYCVGTDADPRYVELVLRGSRRIVRRRGARLVVLTHQGAVCAAAGVDRSNCSAHDRAVLLPLDPQASALGLQARIREQLGVRVSVIVSDSHGRAHRRGTVGVALACAGAPAVVSMTGALDSAGRRFRSAEVHVADQLASAAELVMGATGGVPAVLVTGIELPRVRLDDPSRPPLEQWEE